ncbi:hypothetical protein PRIEUP_LOCUS871, partial [Pristimantis euphronides]
GPYYCAEDSRLTAVTTCFNLSSRINLTALITQTQYYASIGLIDPPSNLSNSRVYIYSGSLDSIIAPGVVKKQELYYTSYITGPGAIKTKYDIPAEHGMPTDNYGGACGSLNNEYIINCDYNGAYEALNHI